MTVRNLHSLKAAERSIAAGSLRSSGAHVAIRDLMKRRAERRRREVFTALVLLTGGVAVGATVFAGYVLV